LHYCRPLDWLSGQAAVQPKKTKSINMQCLQQTNYGNSMLITGTVGVFPTAGIS